VRDFMYEPVPNSCKAPDVFEPSPSLTAADWHMQNPQRNHGLLGGKALFRPIKPCRLFVAEVAMRVHERELRALTQYSEHSKEDQYPTGHSEVEKPKLKRRRQDHGAS
jgi:hypothetical protein